MEKTKEELAFKFIKDRARFFNKFEIEKECGIKRTSLGTSISRDQINFQDSDKLVFFLIRILRIGIADL